MKCEYHAPECNCPKCTNPDYVCKCCHPVEFAQKQAETKPSVVYQVMGYTTDTPNGYTELIFCETTDWLTIQVQTNRLLSINPNIKLKNTYAMLNDKLDYIKIFRAFQEFPQNQEFWIGGFYNASFCIMNLKIRVKP